MSDSADDIAAALAARGYCITQDFPGPALTGELLALAQGLPPTAFRPAGVGRAQGLVRDASIRGDEIHWLDPASPAPAAAAWFAAMESLREAVNRRLYLGLFDYECHLARYPVGAYYRRHLDSFRGGPTRVLSTVLYLNPDWQDEDGGELMMYAGAQAQGMYVGAQAQGEAAVTRASPLERVQPCFGRFVVFLSAGFPHEVLPARRERLSVAGWFRLRP